jgi:hypothetical protein
MLEVSPCVEREFQVSVVFPDPVCHHEACTKVMVCKLLLYALL